MIIDPNSRLLDRVPDIFLSPYPADDASATDAFRILMERAKGGGLTTVGADLMSQAGAEVWNQATQLLWKKKATLSGDVLGEVWGKVAWINPKTDTPAGLLAEIPFELTSDPTKLLGAMASVAVDLALNAISAVPVAGWIIGIVVGVGNGPRKHLQGAGDGCPCGGARQATVEPILLKWARRAGASGVDAVIQGAAAGPATRFGSHADAGSGRAIETEYHRFEPCATEA